MNNKDKEYVYMTGQFSITINRKRETHLDGTPFTDRQMVEASIPHIRHTMHERGAAPENSRYHIAGEPTLLSKDVAKTLLKSNLLMIWNEDLTEAKKGLPHPDNKHWVDICQRELDTIDELETYEEVTEYFSDHVHSEEPRSEDLLKYLLELFVEGETSTTRP